jgi:hypothetical protein|tara:strand:+ start:441 stop:932 length:492 start_codon:yes stop_codon:yes gene_type:complete
MQEIKNPNIKITGKLKSEMIITDILSEYYSGKFRMVVKTKLGMTVCDARDWDNPRIKENPDSAISGYKSGALQTVQFCPEGSDFWLTIFSRTGKKVKLIDESILAALTVGTINGMYSNTNLMDMNQYKLVNSKSWASMAFVMNESAPTEWIEKAEAEFISPAV